MSNRRKLFRLVIVIPTVTILTATSAIAQWSAPIQCSNSTKVFTFWQFYDFDAAGKIHMTWKMWDNDGTNADLFYANNTTGAWSGSKLVTGSESRLIITPDQVIHFFYRYNNHIYERTKPVSGGSWSSPVQVDQNPAGGYFADIIIDDTGGILCCWLHLFDPNANPASAAWARYKPLGGSWGPTEFVAGVNNDVWPYGLSCAAVGTRIHAVYRLTNTTMTLYQRVRENGVWGPQTYVTDNAYAGNIIASPTGELAVIYFNADPTPESGTDWNVYCRFSGDGGVTWGPEVVVRDYGDLQRHAVGTYDARGNFYAAWEGRDTEKSEFNLYCRARIGCVWTQPEIIQTECGVTPKALRVHNNVLWCTFSHKFGGPVHNVYLKYKILPDDWTGPVPVTELGATGGENRVLLTWKNPSNSDFLATVVRASPNGYPEGPFKGREVCVKVGTPGSYDSFVDYRLPSNATYYYSVYAQDTAGNWSEVSHAVATTTADITPPANPVGFNAEPYTSRDLKLTWTNPPDVDFKGVLIRVKTTGYPTGPNDGILVCNKQGIPGAMDSFVHTGLVPGITYYYKAFAYDSEPIPNYSSGATAVGIPIEMTVGYAKMLSDGSPVVLYGKVVTANFVSSDACIYVQDADRTSGIRVETSDSSLRPGDVVDVSGKIFTRILSGRPSERFVGNAVVTKTSTGDSLEPLAMTCKSVGGSGHFGLVPGVHGSVGLNNIGLLVKICGRVTYVAGNYIYVDDGSKVPNLYGAFTPKTGVMVKCPSSPPVVQGDTVSVVGVVVGSIPNNPEWTENRAFIQMRDWSELRKW
ncbi:MAG: hypothetical protein ACUVT8_06200 [Armatimonadota bacterium]